MYGGGLKHNVRAVVKAITHRKNGIFQYATIGCGHPWYTDNMRQLPAMEADLFGALKDSALDVLEVRADPAGSATSPTQRFGSRAPATPSRRSP
jgi:2,5-furandicarboxylate decarboxylase 1